MVLNTGITCYSPVLIAGLELRGLVQFLMQPGLPEAQRIHSCAKGRGQEAAKQKRDASRQAGRPDNGWLSSPTTGLSFPQIAGALREAGMQLPGAEPSGLRYLRIEKSAAGG